MEVKALTKAQCARAQQKLFGEDGCGTIQEGVRVRDALASAVTIYRVEEWRCYAGRRSIFSPMSKYPYLLFALPGKRRERIINWQPNPVLVELARTRWPGIRYGWQYAYWLLPAQETELIVDYVRTGTT